jgi:hypothetical protein
VFGGWADALQPVDIVWVLNTDTWRSELLTPDGLIPAARAWHSMSFVPAMRAVVVFGGKDSDDRLLQDLYLLLLETMTWIRLVPVSGPVPPSRYVSLNNFCFFFVEFSVHARERDII